MGENNAENKNLVFTVDGKDYSSLIHVTDMTESVDGRNLSDPIPFIPTGIEITLKQIPKVSRKRFVKLLMADGVSRNRANEMAKNVVSRKENYRTGLFLCRFMEVIFDAESELQKEVLNSGVQNR